MNDMLSSRRFVLGVLGIMALLTLGLEKNQDVGLAISAVVVGIAGANAYQKKGKKDARHGTDEG